MSDILLYTSLFFLIAVIAREVNATFADDDGSLGHFGAAVGIAWIILASLLLILFFARDAGLIVS